MNIRALAIAAGLAAAGSANAAFLGFEAVFDRTSAQGDSYLVFAQFTEVTLLVNVFNANWVSDADFFQTGAPFGADTAPNSGFFGFDPTLVNDTYVTIGADDSAVDSDTGTDPDFAFGSNTIVGGWFDGNPGTPHTGTSILVAQVTVAAGTRGVSGPLSGTAQVTFEDSGGGQQSEATNFVPTPGAMALFGLAGLTAIRRRRA